LVKRLYGPPADVTQNGVALDAFASPGPRSATGLLVKNLPFGTTATTIRSLFSAHGALERIVVPPSGAIAIVEFSEPAAAKAAFQTLAYRQIGNAPMYLERAPMGIWNVDGNSAAAASRAASPSAAPPSSGEPERDDAEEGATLFIKNLAFGTTTDRLAATFSHMPGFAFARVQTKPDMRRPTERLSMGFGFLGFRSAQAARESRPSVQGFLLDGHALEATFARRTAEPMTSFDGNPIRAPANNGSTILVKNLPFEATKKNVRDLFRCVPSSLTVQSLTGLQSVRPDKVVADAAEDRPGHPRLRVPRIQLSSRGRGRHGGAPPHTSPRPASGHGNGLG
jgi:multiple RNA-binding domain-containing protein 1